MEKVETIWTLYKLRPPSPDYIQRASFTSRLLRPTAVPVLNLLAKLHGVGQPLVWHVVEVGDGHWLANTGNPAWAGFERLLQPCELLRESKLRLSSLLLEKVVVK